jgi:hypothetical protein
MFMMLDTPKDKLIKELAAFITVNVTECTQKNAMDIAKWAVQSYQEQTGVEINQDNCADVMAQILKYDLVCFIVDDIQYKKLIQELISCNNSMNSEIYQSSNRLLIWYIKSKTALNDGLIINLTEVLWKRVIKRIKLFPNLQHNPGSKRLYNLLIEIFLSYTTSQTVQGLRQRIGVAENVAVNHIFTKALNGDQVCISILKDYLLEKLPPICLHEYQEVYPNEYQSLKSDIKPLVETIIQMVLEDILSKSIKYIPKFNKNFLLFIQKEYLETKPDQKIYTFSLNEMLIGLEDERIDKVNDECAIQERLKIKALTRMFELVLRCGGFPHEQLCYLFLEYLTTKPSAMIESNLHNIELAELRDLFWNKIAARLSRYDFESQKYLILLNPLDIRLKLEINQLPKFRRKFPSAIGGLEIGKTKLSNYNNIAGRSMNLAISLWKRNVHRALSGLSLPDTEKMVNSSSIDDHFNIWINNRRERCKLKDIVPCGGENGTGCMVCEMKQPVTQKI